MVEKEGNICGVRERLNEQDGPTSSFIEVGKDAMIRQEVMG